jgi:hypothetical protein
MEMLDMNFNDSNELDVEVGSNRIQIKPNHVTLLAQKVSKSFNKEKVGKFLALRDVSFLLEKG